MGLGSNKGKFAAMGSSRRGLLVAVLLLCLLTGDRSSCFARKTTGLDAHDESILETAWRTRQQGDSPSPVWSSSTVAGSSR